MASSDIHGCNWGFSEIETLASVTPLILHGPPNACRADVVIATDAEHLGTVVCSVTQGKGAFAAVDCVGGELTGEMLSSVKEGGTLLVYGEPSFYSYKTSTHSAETGCQCNLGRQTEPEVHAREVVPEQIERK